MDIYGDWINRELKVESYPFKHIIIDNFLNDKYYKNIINVLPEKVDNTFWKYCNPIEVKYVLDDKNIFHNNITNLIHQLSSEFFISKLKNIFDINDIEADETLHGSGLHYHPRMGRLNMHLDYEKHPIKKNRQRRLNIIFYLNEIWDESWNGATELWDAKMTNCIKKSFPNRNRALIFETSELSWHGVPEKILCPENVFRKSLALYYLSPLKSMPDGNKLGADINGYRNKAVFVKRPQDKYDERMEKLYKIRPIRRINDQDMSEIWPYWDINT